MREFAISDIHGCANTFKALVQTINLQVADHLFLLGDYINRGSRSKQVIDFILQLNESNYQVHALKGNHEDLALDSIRLVNWPGGYDETLESFGVSHLNEIDKSYIEWFSNLPNYLLTENYIFVHAGLNFLRTDPLEDKISQLWIRNWQEHINKQWLGKRIIVHGHTPVSISEIKSQLERVEELQFLDIDNGCVFTNKAGFGNLVCVNLTDRELIVQANID